MVKNVLRFSCFVHVKLQAGTRGARTRLLFYRLECFHDLIGVDKLMPKVRVALFIEDRQKPFQGGHAGRIATHALSIGDPEINRCGGRQSQRREAW